MEHAVRPEVKPAPAGRENDKAAYMAALTEVPPELVEVVPQLAAAGKPQYPVETLVAATADWRGDIARYLLEQLGAAEVVIDVPAQHKRLVVPGDKAPEVDVAGQSLPFLFNVMLPIMPEELEKLAPAFGRRIAELETAGERWKGRAHLERAMGITAWVMTRCQMDDALGNPKMRELVARVSPDGVDVVWRRRPVLTLEQDAATWALIVRTVVAGVVVPKRPGTVAGTETRQ